MNPEDIVGAYACQVLSDRSAGCITSVTRFEPGDRHAVYRVSFRDAVGGADDVVVRVSTRGEPAERLQAEFEAAVLTKLQGNGAPRLYEFRDESAWFRAPVMCMQFIDGEQRDVASIPPADLSRFGAVLASVHNLPVVDLADKFPGARTLMGYIGERLKLNCPVS